MKPLGQFLAVLTWLLVACSVVIIAGGLFGRPLLLAAVPTGSMVPVLKPGDLIAVLPTWLAPAAAMGRIVVYRTPKDQDWVVHRIVGGNPADGFVTKGDANPMPDPHPVRPQDIAGVVPEWGGGVLRIPQLGLLSTGQSPLSSPVVSGVALGMGVYLLVLDMRPRFRLNRVASRARARARPEAILSLYLGLAGTAFLTTLIPAWTLSGRQFARYEIVTQKPASVHMAGQYIAGELHTEEVLIENPSPLPLLVVFAPEDPHVAYTPAWAVIPGRQQHLFRATVANPVPGTYQSLLHTGVFLPLLPPGLLAWLALRSMALAALVSALWPSLMILGMALVDVRSRLALVRLRTSLALRLRI